MSVFISKYCTVGSVFMCNITMLSLKCVDENLPHCLPAKAIHFSCQWATKMLYAQHVYYDGCNMYCEVIIPNWQKTSVGMADCGEA